MPRRKSNPFVGSGIVLLGNILLLIVVSRFDVFAGPSTPDVVGQIFLGFLGTNFIIVAWMIIFGMIGFWKTSMIGAGGGYIVMSLLLLSLL